MAPKKGKKDSLKKPSKPASPAAAAPVPKPTRVRKAPAAAPAKATDNAGKATPAYVDLAPAPPPVLKDIPWGYGDIRCTAMARDPQWAYAYWEISDESIAAARKHLSDPQAGLSLRIYDTTGRDFNGLNAHSHWDLGIDRGTTVYHFKVGRPGATIHVDVGVRTWSGDFTPIARSGAVEMPRDSMSPDTRVEATTVFRSGPAYTYRHRYVAPPPSAEPPPPPIGESPYPAESEQIFRHLAGEGWARTEWTESLMDGRVVRWIRWSGPVPAEHLALLPKSGAAFRSIEVLFKGERRVVRTAAGEQVVYGPWKVTLEAVGAQGERRTIEHWMIRRRWTTDEGMIRVETPAVLVRILGGRRVTVARSGSETRLGQETWGSEHLMVGASEWRWIGASENMAQGSSESLQAGSSEAFYIGASEYLYLGASETFGMGSPGGSSEERP